MKFDDNEITEDYLDDLVSEWHRRTHKWSSLENYIKGCTGFTAEQYHEWVTEGKIPDDE